MKLWFQRKQPQTLTSLQAYQLWAESYPPHAHNALMHAEENAMLDLLPSLKNCNVLDLASGTGRYGKIALERGAQHVAALDNSLAMLQQSILDARVLGTLEHLPIRSEQFDVVICGLAIGHLASLPPVLNEIARVLKKGGITLISDVHPSIFLNGAKRTFQAKGTTYAVEHTPHLISDVLRAAQAAGLAYHALAETTSSDPALPVNARVPVAVVYALIKPL